MNPEISIVVCTYNGMPLLKKCVDSIFRQTFNNFEVIFIDGGSTDGTLEFIKDMVKKHKKVRFYPNKKRLPEGRGFGKWLGFNKSRGKVVGIVDQDNVLQRDDFFQKIIDLARKENDIMAITAGLTGEKKDSLLVRYVSLFGTDSFFSYRSIDSIRVTSGRIHDVDKYIIQVDNTPLVGSNCLFYVRKIALSAGSYDRDVLINDRLIRKGKNILFVINNATKHYTDRNLRSLAIKKFKWGKNYFLNKEDKSERFNYMPKTSLERNEFYKNLIFNLLVFPNLYYSLKAYKTSNDPVAFLFPILALLNTVAYGLNFMRMKIGL